VPPFLKVREMAAVLAGARTVVGLDTGFTHLGAAFGRPTVGIYCDHEPGLAGVTASGPVQSYQWQRETAPGSNSFVNLPNGPSTPFGGSANVGGATTQQLAVVGSPRLNAMDAVKYRCVVTGPCGSVTSGAALLMVCPADYDCNGFVNGDDFDAFTLNFEHGWSWVDTDVNHDGFVNSDDYDLFAAVFEAGC